MWRGSGRRIAGIGSASAKTPTTGSEGEPGIASTARGSEPGYPIRPPRQTTAEPGPSPRCNGAQKARLLRSDPRTDPLPEQRSRSGHRLAGPLASDEAHQPRCGVLLLDGSGTDGGLLRRAKDSRARYSLHAIAKAGRFGFSPLRASPLPRSCLCAASGLASRGASAGRRGCRIRSTAYPSSGKTRVRSKRTR
jgi:hypothetical protein